MEFYEYQDLAKRTSSFPDHNKGFERWKMAFFGIFGEAGELADELKKVMWHGHDFDREKLRDELGDLLWYVSEIATALDFDLDDVAILNVEKLKRRYPEGFSEEASRNRKG